MLIRYTDPVGQSARSVFGTDTHKLTSGTLLEDLRSFPLAPLARSLSASKTLSSAFMYAARKSRRVCLIVSSSSHFSVHKLMMRSIEVEV